MTVDLRRTRAHRFGAAVRVSRDGRGARVWYEPAGNRIGVDRLLGPEQVYANPAATRRGDLQGAVGKLQAPQVTHRPGPFTESQIPLPCASSWTAPSWRCTAAAPRSPTACIPLPPPPASTSTQRAEWPTSGRFPCGRCAALGDLDDSARQYSGQLIVGHREAVHHIGRRSSRSSTVLACSRSPNSFSTASSRMFQS